MLHVGCVFFLSFIFSPLSKTLLLSDTRNTYMRAAPLKNGFSLASNGEKKKWATKIFDMPLFWNQKGYPNHLCSL